MASFTVRELMSEDPKAIGPEENLEVVRETFYELGIRHLPVVDEEHRLLGLVTHRDMLRNIFSNQAEMPISLRQDVLRRKMAGTIMIEDVVTTEPGSDLREAAQVMFDNKFGCLPVVEGERLVGILTEADFVRHFAESED